jgi:hypothetical protein
MVAAPPLLKETFMHLYKKKLIVPLLATSFTFLQVAPAYAGMVGTQSLIDHASTKIDRDRLKGALQRDEVRKLLTSHGVTTEQAKARIDALTHQEVSQLAGQFDNKPAGGLIIETVIAAALVVVILEVIGITDIFPQF